MVRRKFSIGVILTLILIVGGILALAGYKSIPDLWYDVTGGNNVDDSIPFRVNLSPEYFDEGNYESYNKIPFSIEINQITGRNITYLELSKSNFKASREDGNLNKPTSYVNWKDSNSNNVFSFSYSENYHNQLSSLKSEGQMSLCQNCFIGTDYPYIFTFTVYYKENNGVLKSKTFNEIISIK